MNRAERRARKHWHGEPADPMGALRVDFATFGEAVARMALVTGVGGEKLETEGGTLAQAEALTRWAIHASAAFRRGAADLDRLSDQLASIAGLPRGAG